MKLQLKTANVHKDMVTAVAWTPENEMYSVCDDKTIHKWSMSGEPMGKVCSLEVYGTALSWFPGAGKQASDMFAMACSDGTIRLMSRAGREEKKMVAHTGAVVRVHWSYDGSALCSCGEDGEVKIWSRSGNLRSTLLQTGQSIYALAWSPDNEQLLVGIGKDLAVKRVQAGQKQLQWVAHEGVVLAVDWNMVNNLLVSGAEDCTYRVWDAFGRQLYCSSPYGQVITAVSWSPNGECFAVGAFNMLRLCDRTGWTHARERPASGSIMAIAWTPDGTQLAGAGGNGTVVFAQIVERALEWGNFEAVLVESHKIRVQDVGQESHETLDFPRDRVVEMALGYRHLVVATATQVFIYSVSNWNTPYIFDVRGAVSLIVLSQKHFVTVDNLQGVQVWTYEGRQVSNPRFQNLRAEFLNRNTISLSSDTVAILDRTDSKSVRVCDVQTGRALQESTITHECEIVEIALNQFAPALTERRLIYIDINRDLWITPVTQMPGIARGRLKIHTQVDSCCWNDQSDMLAAVADGRLVTWYYPNAVYVDKDLLELARASRDSPEFGKAPQIRAFYGNKVTVRRADGALLSTSVAPYPVMLYEFVGAGSWDEALRLCRFIKNEQLWACLAGMALHGRNLDKAEEALAAIKQVDKLEYVLYMKGIPSEEGRNAELALYRRCPDEAEHILLQATPPLVYRAIKLNVKLFRWSRALDIAVQHRTHVDTVLGYRQSHLQKLKRPETDPRFLQYSQQVTIDWDTIKAKKEKEKEDELQRAGSRGGALSHHK